MGVFKRLRDSATGMFVSRKQFDILPKGQTQAETYGEVPKTDRAKLRLAWLQAARAETTADSYQILNDAVYAVLQGKIARPKNDR